MRRILLAVTCVVGLVLLSLSLGATVPGPSTGSSLPTPLSLTSVPGSCFPGAQQCSPAVPAPNRGPSPAIGVASALAATTGALVARAWFRRRRVAESLPSGFLVTLLRPPRNSLSAF